MSANQYKTRIGKRDTMLKKVSKSSYLLVFLHILSQVAQHYLLRRLATQSLPLYYPPQRGVVFLKHSAYAKTCYQHSAGTTRRYYQLSTMAGGFAKIRNK